VRFFLFGGKVFYPRGGMDDINSEWHTADDAIAAAIQRFPYNRDGYDHWWHVYDSQTGDMVARDPRNAELEDRR
jgi:hypothetical protein